MRDVPPARKRFNVCVFVMGREYLPQDRDAAVDSVIRNEPVLPHRGDQLIATDDVVLMAEKEIEEPGHLRLQLCRVLPIVQNAGAGIEGPMSEFMPRGIFDMASHRQREALHRRAMVCSSFTIFNYHRSA
ncbi:MAG: hypothetical protein R3192_16635 [Woeseiaceae bacterium]|nr:hypothetical protein [Woeseiaceae bacterium]